MPLSSIVFDSRYECHYYNYLYKIYKKILMGGVGLFVYYNLPNLPYPVYAYIRCRFSISSHYFPILLPCSSLLWYFFSFFYSDSFISL